MTQRLLKLRLKTKPKQKALSVSTLKCVLEHLEANKRIHISSRSPTLRLIDKLVPFKIVYLNLQNSKITINNITYEVKSTRERIEDDSVYPTDFKPLATPRTLMPGDILMDPLDSKYNERTEIIIQKTTSGRTRTRHVPVYRDEYVATKQLANFLLGGRNDIRANRLDIKLVDENALLIPVGLKIRVNRLDTQYDIDRVSQFLHDSSFPLKSLKISIWRPHYFEHPIIQSAEKLVIVDYGKATPLFWVDELLKQTNKHVQLDYIWLSSWNIMTLIKNLIDKNREIGTCFELETTTLFSIMLLRNIRKQFNRVAVNLKKQEKRFLTDFRCSAIPINQTSEMCIHGSEFITGFVKIKIKISPIGSSPAPVEDNFGIWYFVKLFVEVFDYSITSIIELFN